MNLSHPHFSTFCSLPSSSIQKPDIVKGSSSTNVLIENMNLKGSSIKILGPSFILSTWLYNVSITSTRWFYFRHFISSIFNETSISVFILSSSSTNTVISSNGISLENLTFYNCSLTVDIDPFMVIMFWAQLKSAATLSKTWLTNLPSPT